MQHKTSYKILFILTAICFAPNVLAFTGLTNQYFASKIMASTDLNCYTAFIQGAIAPDQATTWQTYPDLSPNNQTCYNNDLNCTTRQKSIEYKQKSEQETDQCKKSYLLGISINLMQESYDPSNWTTTIPACKTEFDKSIENSITSFVPNYDIQKECSTDTGNTVRLHFQQLDENNLINSLRQFYTVTQPQIQQQALEQTAKDIVSIISQQLDQNLNEQDIKITTQLLTEIEAYSCLLSPIRKQQAYQDWQNLDQTAKTCLKDFTSSQGTQAYTFVAECAAFNYVTGDPYAIYSAQTTLDQYFQNNFAQKQCRELYIPTLTLAGASPTQGMLKQEICEYVPTQSIKGCLTEFETQKKREDQIWQDAAGITTLVLGILAVIIIGAYSIISSSGN